MENNTIINIGRKAWGVCLLGKGLQQIFFGSIDPNFLPLSVTSNAASNALVYPWGALFIVAGVALLFNKMAYQVSLISGSIFLLLFLFVYAPYMIFFSGKAQVLLEWAPAVQELGFAGSSFAVAASFAEETYSSTLIMSLKRLIPLAGILFSCPMIVFGIAHMIYATMISAIVPSWIPYHLFWTYFTGAALIAAGLAISLKINTKLAACLLALMIFSWLLMMHIPRSIITPPAIRKIELSRVFVTIGYTGAALLFAFVKKLGGGKKAFIAELRQEFNVQN